MARYHRYSSRTASEEPAAKEDEITKKRVEQLNSEIKIEEQSQQDYYAKKALRKARRRKHY